MQPITIPQMFNLEGLTPILPFDNKSLAPHVASDHAEVAVNIFKKAVIAAWNISNPAHHHYFKSTPVFPQAPFHMTHLYVEKPVTNGVICPSLQEKIRKQISWIADQFGKGKVNIQVIVEGYKEFYKELGETIGRTQQPFEIFSLIDQNSLTIGPNKNVTGILIDTYRFSIEDRGVAIEQYKEEANGRDCEFIMPYVRVKERETQKSFVIAGVHIPGVDSSFPQSGLGVLNKHIRALHSKFAGECDILAVGDFNTPPMHAKASLVGLEILFPPYPTHVTPRSEAAVFDQAAILKGSNPVSYQIHEDLGLSSQFLVAAIHSNYLGKALKAVEETMRVRV